MKKTDPLRDFMILSLAVAATVTSGHSYASSMSDSRHHAYIHNGIGRASDEGVKTMTNETVSVTQPRTTPTLWASSHGIGYAYDLNASDRLGMQVGYHTYGVRQVRYPSSLTTLNTTVADLKYSGVSAMMLGSHFFGKAHRVSLGGGIQRSIIKLGYRNYDSTSSVETLVQSERETYNWQPKILTSYQYFPKDNVSITLSFTHTWGEELDGYINKAEEDSGTYNAYYMRAKRVPSLNALLLGFTFYV